MMIDERQICQQWLDTKVTTVKSITYDKYETIINKYILPLFQKYPMDQLNTNEISDYLNALYDQGLSGYMVKLIKLILNSIYDFAHVIYDYPSIDFTKIILHIQSEKKTLGNLDKEQEDILFQYCMLDVNALNVSILLALYAGLRCCEICALKIEDIHLDEGYIDVNKQSERVVNRKNNESKTLVQVVDLSWPEKRQVVLQPFMIDYLRQYIQYSYPDLFLLTRTFRIPVKRTYENKLKILGTQLGMNVSYSILRNTCKSNCINNDVNIMTLLNMFGLTKLEININDSYHEEIDYTRKQLAKIQPNI